MKRRDVLIVLGGAAASWEATVARAKQSAGMPVIGVLVGADNMHDDTLAAFLEGLQQSGWRNGHNVRIARRPSSAST
jgi:hypothetical protein